MPKYRLYDADGNDLGEIFLGPGKRLKVLDVVPVEEEDSPYVGLLKVEAA